MTPRKYFREISLGRARKVGHNFSNRILAIAFRQWMLAIDSARRSRARMTKTLQHWRVLQGGICWAQHVLCGILEKSRGQVAGVSTRALRYLFALCAWHCRKAILWCGGHMVCGGGKLASKISKIASVSTIGERASVSRTRCRNDEWFGLILRFTRESGAGSGAY